MPSALENYSSVFSSELPELLQNVLDFTKKNHPHAHMVSSKEQGLLLKFISHLMQPQRILEIGTFTGFSGLCLAYGLPKNGQLHTIELREADAITANDFFNQSPFKHQIHLHIGNAMKIIPILNEKWDLIFIDADKTNYISYYEMVLPQLNENGLIIADNVLFHGQVLEENITGKNAKAIAAFNEHIKADSRIEHVLLTVRDGLMLIRKK